MISFTGIVTELTTERDKGELIANSFKLFQGGGLVMTVLIGLLLSGQAGLERVLELLEDEVRICLGLLGARSFEELTMDFLHPAEPVVSPHALSAFPFLAEEGY